VPTPNPSTPLIEVYDPNQKIAGAVIFQNNLPVEMNTRKQPNRVDLLYRQEFEMEVNIKMLVGIFDAKTLHYPEDVIKECARLAETPLEKLSADPLYTWSYVEMLERYDVSFVVCRDIKIYPKFFEDKFRQVFNGRDIAIFQATK